MRRHAIKVASAVSVEVCCLAVGEVVGHSSAAVSNPSPSNWNHGGISGDVHFAGHLWSNRTNVVRDKRYI